MEDWEKAAYREIAEAERNKPKPEIGVDSSSVKTKKLIDGMLKNYSQLTQEEKTAVYLSGLSGQTESLIEYLNEHPKLPLRTKEAFIERSCVISNKWRRYRTGDPNIKIRFDQEIKKLAEHQAEEQKAA
ncbi:hypothetical protein HYS93_03865 [Candidatus Daviesbacteria bacterium]|nr:hypothetical protein [Candidatus Daviesbacteria bacterium]